MLYHTAKHIARYRMKKKHTELTLFLERWQTAISQHELHKNRKLDLSGYTKYKTEARLA